MADMYEPQRGPTQREELVVGLTMLFAFIGVIGTLWHILAFLYHHFQWVS